MTTNTENSNEQLNPLLQKVQIPGEKFRLPSGGLFYNDGELDESVRHVADILREPKPPFLLGGLWRDASRIPWKTATVSSDLLERLLEVRDQVLAALDATGHPHERVGDAECARERGGEVVEERWVRGRPVGVGCR